MPGYAFVALLALTLSTSAGAHAGPAHGRGVRSSTVRVHAPSRLPPAARGSIIDAPITKEASVPADRLFALRERRRIAAYLRMRLLEMREEGLERAAEAVRRRLPADVLTGSP
jgi:hypothetical protein